MEMENSMSDQPRQRRQKIKYEFHKRRSGDVFKVRDAKARVYYMSAFANWKRNRPGTLAVKSVKVEDGYLLRFSGISPAEVNTARISGEDI
jgi:hypothetical protein